jgi:hypothetical protein
VRAAILALVLVVPAIVARAEDRGTHPRVDAIVPVPPTEHHRLYWFGRRQHHLVPGVVTIDALPYVCDLDAKEFGDRDRFVAHLHEAHRTPSARIPDLLLVRDGRVHFVGE